MTVTPAQINLTIYQGATFAEEFEWKTQAGDSGPVVAVDLTGYVARMQVRPSANSSVVLLDCTSTNGKIVIDGGDIIMNVSAAETAALSFDTAYYDLELVLADYPSAGQTYVYRALQGAVTLSREVTK